MTSIHANDTLTAIDRLIELGAPRHTVSAGLIAVVAQRLIRRLCRHCRIPDFPEARTRVEFGLQPGIHVYRAQGCADCGGEGYAGRTGIFEVLVVSDDLRSLIASGSSTRLCDRGSFDTMLSNALHKVLAGDTTLEEVRRLVPPRTEAA